MDTKTQFEKLVGSRAWSGKPESYSSMIYFTIADNGEGKLICGFGQTIYADLKCQFDTHPNNVLSLKFFDSSRGWRGKQWSPSGSDTKNVNMELTKGEFRFHQDFNKTGDLYVWKLELSEQPFPDELEFPYPIPTEYYGYRTDDA